jgi:N-methylhydantoinase A/oxoprolinase/acetone carboxylase beta subunit
MMNAPKGLRIGIDVGGTNTDAAIVDPDGQVVAKTKQFTTADVTTGMENALAAVLDESGVERERITHVMLSTTHATNAVIERTRLNRVAVVRIGRPSTTAIRPLYTWPAALREVVSAGEINVRGGIEFNGNEIASLDRDAIARFLEPLAGHVDGVAITSVFASVSDRHEQEAAKIARELLGESAHISLSNEIGSIGLLERENATVLNSALVGVAAHVAGALDGALAAHGLRAATFFAQNDGTLMALDYALRYPVLTIGSGPANSIRGAAYLSKLSDAIVIDVGGTSSDVGVLVNGFPRESSAGGEIGGIKTNFRMPDLVAIALGGGSILSRNGNGAEVGPRSVGHDLRERALIFGGDVPTLSDAAVSEGRAQFGSKAPASGHRELLRAGLAEADLRLAEAIDMVKTAPGDAPLIIVGGGGVLVPPTLPGISEMVRPENFDVANAVGAAVATVSAQVDRIFQLGVGGRKAALDEATEQAREQAIRAGARADTVEIVAIEELPLTYLTTPALRMRVKAAGALSIV